MAPPGISSTASGVALTAPVRLLQWQQAIEAREYEMLERQGAVERYLHSTAARALGDKMARDSAIKITEYKPSPDDPWGGMRRIIRWSVGVVDRIDTESFAKQLNEARAEGLRRAAEMAGRKAALYRSLSSDGPCGHVIAGSLEDIARSFEEAATALAAADTSDGQASPGRDQ